MSTVEIQDLAELKGQNTLPIDGAPQADHGPTTAGANISAHQGLAHLAHTTPDVLARVRQSQIDQCARLAAKRGGAVWTEGWVQPPQVPEPLPTGLFTFALAERTATAFVRPHPEAVAFRDFAEVFGSEPHVRADKKSGGLVTFNHMVGRERLCVLPNGRVWNTGGIGRAVISSAGVTAIGLDFDKCDTSVAALVAKLEALGLEGLVHTTFSHTEAKPKLRAILPLIEPRRIAVYTGRPLHGVFDRRAWKGYYLGVAKMVGAGTADPSCSDPVRLFYLPAHKPGAPYEWRYVEGKPLDLRTVTPWAPPRATRTYAPSDGPIRASLARITVALSVIPASCGYLEWRNAVWAIHSAVHGTPDEEAGRRLAEEWSQSCPALFEQETFDDLWDAADPEGGITINTLLSIARKYGLPEPRKTIGRTTTKFRR